MVHRGRVAEVVFHRHGVEVTYNRSGSEVVSHRSVVGVVHRGRGVWTEHSRCRAEIVSCRYGAERDIGLVTGWYVLSVT